MHEATGAGSRRSGGTGCASGAGRNYRHPHAPPAPAVQNSARREVVPRGVVKPARRAADMAGVRWAALQVRAARPILKPLVSRPAFSRPPAPQRAGPPTLHALHALRVRRTLLLGSGIAIATSVGWGLFFLLRGNWFVVGFDIVTAALGGTIAFITTRGHARAASYLMVATMFVVMCVNALLLDIPTPLIPRSTHAFLIALGVVSCLLMREEPGWLRHGVPALCLATYVVLGSTHLGWVNPYALPESVRASGVWINHGTAMLTVVLVLHVIQNDAAERTRLEGELRDALLRGELLLHYQPQFTADDRIVGAEALLRWQHPQRGMVPPGEFVPLAERTGLMLPMGEWVLKTACEQLAAWQRRPDTAGLVVAVNVSALQVAQADFVDRVLACAEQAGIDPAGLKLELTESMLAHDVDDIITKMTALKARGIGFSLDDFGTGYSSLSYLRRLPLDQLKIDQSFVANMLHSPKEAAIVQALISLGHDLGIALIAEGVETPEQRRALHDKGCTVYQGYLFGRPVASAAFEALLATARGACDTARPRPQAACASASCA
ncbi:MAG: EAL domain-containing protein [Rhizobacter sp.]|nr:EAL domain-containing protein [Rhizobacter sp.]